MSSKNIELISQALGAAESSIKLAKQLLADLETGKEGSAPQNSKTPDNLPGIVGVFDGEAMKSESGEVYPVPANYASKSLLVVGDTLKLVEEGKNREKRFKQVEHVKRQKTSGILAKKEGKWKVVTPEGSYKVLPAAVEHFGAEIGSEVVLQIPAGNLNAPWGALENVKSKETEVTETPSPIAEKPEHKEEPKEIEQKVSQEKPKIEKKEPPKPKPAAPKEEPKKELPKVEKVEVKEAPAPKVEEPKKVETPAPPKVEETKKVEATPPPAPKVEAPKVEVPKPQAASAPVATSEPAIPTPPIEVSPEEDELT
ncbi:MAG TPA: hypothetical protein VLE47_00535 [Candidatus Saccharimonadales bacterium]|nr:hypothetical protein [Candidatus Saccharimonadales bacterium]